MDAFFDELCDGVCVSDDEGGILYLNPAAEALLNARVPQSQGRTLCELLCGRMAAPGVKDFASVCELRDPASPCEGVTFHGRYGPLEIAEWKDFHVRRRSAWKSLRVRCLRAAPSLTGGGRHLTLIQDRSG